MTLKEITEMLKAAAAEDAAIAKSEGIMCISGTRLGVITLEYKSDTWFAHVKDYPTYATSNSGEIIDFLARKYEIVLEGELKRTES